MKTFFRKLLRQRQEKIEHRPPATGIPAGNPRHPAPALHRELPHPRRMARSSRSYCEEEANHDRWVEGLSPRAVAFAAMDLEPPRRSRWRKEGPPHPYEIWRIERHAALLRRIEREHLYSAL